ncbi:MAG: methionyl-tRNA formyltransferase [bacterium]
MAAIQTIFVGSGEFAAIVLKKLAKSEIVNIIAVISQPDKPMGRKQSLTPCPVAAVAQELKLALLQPQKLQQNASQITEKYCPELIVVTDYGQMIPKVMLDYPKYHCLNIHGSLLPDLRGAVPIPMAILRGYQTTGISIPVMTPGLDDGPIIGKLEVKIAENDTTASLKKRLAELGSDYLLQLVPDWTAGNIIPEPQAESKATFCQTDDLAKEKAQFTSKNRVSEVDRMCRAFFPWPIAWTNVIFNGKTLRLKVFALKKSVESLPAGLIQQKDQQLLLGLSDGAVELIQLQLEGKQQGAAQDYQYLHNSRLLL